MEHSTVKLTNAKIMFKVSKVAEKERARLEELEAKRAGIAKKVEGRKAGAVIAPHFCISTI